MVIPLPEIIEKHRYSEIFGEWWRQVNVEDGLVCITICGKRGSGKSMITLFLMWLLDRDSTGKSFFSQEKVAFKASDFLEWLNKPKEEWRRGSVIALDDAGLHLYNRDALSEFVKTITKTLQNIRFKHPIIILNLPSFQMLDKHGRDLTDVYIEAVDRDKNRRENLVKIHNITTNPFYGAIFRKNISKIRIVKHPELGIDVCHRVPVLYRIELPPVQIRHAYLARKDFFMSNFNAQNIKLLRNKEEARLKGKISRTAIDLDVLEFEARKRLDELKNEHGRIIATRIADVLNVNYNTARRLCLRLKLPPKTNSEQPIA